jgi:hypothetical protein
MMYRRTLILSASVLFFACQGGEDPPTTYPDIGLTDTTVDLTVDTTVAPPDPDSSTPLPDSVKPPVDSSVPVDAPPKPPIDAAVPQADTAPPADQGVPPVTTGAIVVTEFLADPYEVSDTAGEWLELYNPGSTPIDIKGWTLEDDGSNSHIIASSVIVPAKGYAVLGRNATTSANGGVQLDYEYSSFSLTNSDDEIILLDASKKEVDRVAYGDQWFVFNGYSTSVKDPNADNNDKTNWCFAGGPWAGSAGDWGSPGKASVCAPEVPRGCTHTTTKTIQFNPSLCPGIIAGYKKITLRNNHASSPKAGDWARLYCTGANFAFEALITEARHTTYGGITAQEYTDDGFQNQSQMIQIMAQYYPGITAASNATVFRWTDTTLCD